MKVKIINTSESNQRTYAIIMETGDETMDCLHEFARKEKLHVSQFTAIGAFSEVMLGYFDFDIKDYRKIPVEEQVEVLVLTGDISLDKGRQKVHAHVVVGRRDGTTIGGHLLNGKVRPTLEIILTESPSNLSREYDEASGLSLIQIQKGLGEDDGQ